MTTCSRLVALSTLLLAQPVFAQGEPTPTPPTPTGGEPAVPPGPTPTEPPAPVPPTPPPAPTPPPTPPPPAAPADDTAPLQFKIGRAYFTPIGFMDFTGMWRSKNGGSGIGTNFGSIPYGVVPGNYLDETRLSMQNSRIGFRVDAPVHGAHVIGYMEADFLGNNPGNVAVSSNSNTLRSRLYWVDVRDHEWELLAGQTWSLITPSRSGISPIPSSLFITQNTDVNYQAGLVWGRMPELRGVYHPNKMVAVALALEGAEQYMGGSAGGGKITLPMALSALAGTQLNDSTSTFNVPNIAPDVIAKVAIDPAKQIHVEVGGLESQFKVWNPTTDQTFSATGLGGFLNFNVELVDGLRVVSNNFWSSGGGRYIFGQAPDVVVLADGSLQTIKSGSTVSGLEYTHGPTAVAAYYGGIYIGHAEGASSTAAPCMDAMTCVGYGYTGSPTGQNKTIQELTLDVNQTIWKDPKFGALNVMGQYSYLTRDPWSVAAGAATGTHVNMVFLNLRYTLPGAPPKMPD